MMLTRNSPAGEVDVVAPAVVVRKCYHCGHNTTAIEACGVCGMR